MNNPSLKILLTSLLLIFLIYNAALTPLESSASYTPSIHKMRSITAFQKETMLRENVLLQVPTIVQFPELPRGCEVTSLAMLLNFAGISVDKLTLAEQVAKVPYRDHSNLYGSPNQGFIGSMYTFNEPGLTVYNGPIEQLAKQYLPDKIENLTGQDFESVKKKLNQGKPVWVIIGSTFSYLPEEHWETWNTTDGEMKVTRKVHSVLVTGYDGDNVYFNDPFFSQGNRSVNYHDFITSWVQFGSQAISY